MYLGHALLAFVLGALAARLVGVDERRSVLYGAAAAGFGLVPDVDLAYAVVAARLVGPEGLFPTADGWVHTWVVHQSLTHSLLTGAVAAVFAGHVAALVIVRPSPGRRLPPPTAMAAVPGLVGLAGGLAWVAWVAAGPLGAATMLLYAAAVSAVAWLAVRRGATALGIAGAAAVGLLSHPFGDVFTSQPPALLYPLVEATTVPTLTLSDEPTVNIVGLFLLEVGLAWLALGTAVRPTQLRWWRLVRPPAVLGLAFVATAPVIEPPTIESASPFALGVLATGALVGLVTLAVDRARPRAAHLATALATALAAATLAAIGYLAAYVAFG